MNNKITVNGCDCSRRDFLRMGLYGVGISSALPVLLDNTSIALAAENFLADDAAHPERILVVVELSGGNDGLNTLVPYGDDAYGRARPTLAIREEKVRKLDDHFGFHPSLAGFERIYKEGNMALVHGCGYENPSLSHFVSMGFWHTGVPNGGEALGWVGRFADAYCPENRENLIVNIANSQSMAVRSGVHTPLVFNDPARFKRDGNEEQRPMFEQLSEPVETGNESLRFLRDVAANASKSSAFVRQAFAGYQTPIDYGVGNLANDLRKVAALIHAGMPTRIFYVSFQGNAFDTHVHQADTHDRLLMYTSDAINGFMKDLNRLGRADEVAMVLFTEFGRRVEENASGGTDHGTATPMFIVGNGVKGGMYGAPPSLVDLDDGNLKMTTDFRRVYATMIREWMGYQDTRTLLKGNFDTLGAFA